MPYSNKDKQKEAQHRWYIQHKERLMSKQKKGRKDRSLWFDELCKGIHCRVCLESERCALDFHHVDPNTKEYGISNLIRRRSKPEKILAEVRKCVVLCSNCHRKYHAGVIDLPIDIIMGI